MFEIKLLSFVSFEDTFSHSVGGLFTLLMASFEAQVFTTLVDPTYLRSFGRLHFG